MPSMANGRFFTRRPSIASFVNLSEEFLPEFPTFDDDDQMIITSSSTINLVYRILFPCLILIGTCGSIMSLKCLYVQRYRKNNSTYVFFFLISLVDLAILYTGALRLLVIALTGFEKTHFNHYKTPAVILLLGFDVRSTSLFICRAHRFTTYFLLQLSSCLLSLMTLDRARKTLSMLPPLNKTIHSLRTTQFFLNEHHSTLGTRVKQSRMFWITFLVILCLFVLDSHFFYCTGYQHEKNQHKIVCQSVEHHLHCRRYWLVYLWLDAFLYSYLPFFLITICNIRLIIYLKQQRLRRLELTSSTIHLSHHHRMTCSIILMSALFLILSVPAAFLEQFESQLKHYKYFYHSLALAYAGMYFNHTISFFLFLSGTQFRQSVKELIWSQTNQTPKTNTTLFALVATQKVDK